MTTEIKKEAKKGELAERIKEKWNTETELIELLQNKKTPTINIEEVKKLMDHVFDSIMELTDEYGRVQVMGFASFNKVRREIRKGRNPQTGEQVIIPAKNTVTVKPSDNFKNSYISQ